MRRTVRIARTAPNRLSKFIATFLILVLFSGSALATPEVGYHAAVSLGEIGREAKSTWQKTDLSRYLNIELPAPLAALVSTKAESRPSVQFDRIEITQRNQNILQGDSIDFVATAYRGEQPVAASEVRWTIRKADSGETRSLLNGRLKSTLPGNFVVRASSAGFFTETTLTVRPDPDYNVTRILRKPARERTQEEQEQIAAWISSGLLTTRRASSRDPLPTTPGAARTRIDKQDRQVRDGGQPTPDANRPDLADPIGWDNSNYSAADEAGNWVGRPIGAGKLKGAANGNYNLTVPAVNLDGRGIDINLNLEYNSRLWSKVNTEMTYNPDSGYPAPGWNLGFGRMFHMGTNGGCMLIAPDGTRRAYDGAITNYGGGAQLYDAYTVDGSQINYSCFYTPASGGSLSGTATLPNGTRITFGSHTSNYNQAFPTTIQDAHGNYINVSYVNNRGPEINSVTDTLGRTINFTYSSGNLTEITGPGYNGTTRTFLHLQYEQKNLSYAFASGYTASVANSSPHLLKAIYFPTTNTGFWFGETDSYSTYGMIARVREKRGMAWSGGIVTIPGTTTRDETYDFPMTANSSLTDAPGYGTHTETFDGIDTSSLVSTYSVVTSSGVETITRTMPDGSRRIEESQPAANGGMNVKTILKEPSPSSVELDKTVLTFESGFNGSYRVKYIDHTDDKSQTKRKELAYGANYNQVSSEKEFEYGGSPLYRERRYTYENSSNYTSRNIVNLVKTVEDYDGSNNRLTRTVYTYDSGTPVAASGIVQHDDTHDYHTGATVNGDCWSWDPPDAGCTFEGQLVQVFGSYYNCECFEYSQVSAYNPATAYRGNLTNVTTYTDGATPAGSISYDYTYDIAGNERTSTTNCCQQIGSLYSTNTQYLYPDSVTKGSSNTSSPDRMTQIFYYDSNTKLLTSLVDFNSLTTTVAYDAAYRPTLVTMNSDGKKTTTYNDSSLNRNEHVQLANNTTVSNSTVYFNGRGQVKTSTYQAGSPSYNGVQIKYDEMGRQWKVSRPYDTSSSPSYWSETLYDHLGRPTTQTAPDLASVTTLTYNQPTKPGSAASNQGQTVTTRDAWGRERWVRYDAFGRLIEAVEPNPTDMDADIDESGDINTTYDYDRLDRLTQITQGTGGGGQTRKFAYDSLGRLVLQKLAEQTATINGSGTYVGGGGSGAEWGEYFEYDSRSNLKKRMDARGAITTYDYNVSSSPDPLNRLQSISASLASGVSGIDLAPTATIEYMTTGDKTRVKKITTSGVAVEENAFDSESRVSEYKITFDGRTSYPMETDYTYDTAHRLTQIEYPALYGLSGDPRNDVVPSYDVASRLTQLTVEGTTRLGDVMYNAASQVTQLKTAPNATNGKTETYTYDAATGLLTGQTLKKVNTSTTYMNMSYSYDRGLSAGSTSAGKTGQVTEIVDNYFPDHTKKYEFDALGRLKVAKGGLAAGASGVTADWSQTYTYDRYGNRTGTTSAGVDWDSVTVPTDGIASLSYDTASNRVSTSGWEYDHAGNLTKGQNVSGTWQRFKYDSAGRLLKVTTDAGADIETYSYGANRQKLKTETASSHRTYYAWGGSKVIAEYTEAIASSTPAYSKVYYYAGERLVSSNSSGSSVDQYHHPDRLGTKVNSNSFSASLTRQATLPFGTEFPSEGAGTTFNSGQLFTSYDRSGPTGLDYAVNRTYSSGQGRFTQVDPIGMKAATVGNPQSNNLYSYVRNMPTDYVDPSGLNAQGPGSGQSGMLWTLYHYDGREWRQVNQWFEPYPGQGDASGGSSNQPSDCENFATQLGRLAEWGSKNSIASKISIGNELWNWTNEYLAMPKMEYPSGFRKALIEHGQGSDIYRHVTASAASVLLEIGLASWYDDRRSLNEIRNPSTPPGRVAEEAVSLVNNKAGRMIGNLISQRIGNGIDTAYLIDQIKNILCD